MGNSYDELKRHLRETEMLRSIGALAVWDQETMMPRKAAPHRAEELALLSRLVHERATDPRVGLLLDDCESDRAVSSDPVEAANVREIRRDYTRARKVPAVLVAEIARTSSAAMEVWKAARQDNDFASLEPWLEKLFDLHRSKAECHGTPAGGELYDQFLEDYEPGMTAATLERIFAPLRKALGDLIDGARPSPPPLGIRLPVDRQREFNRRIAERVGFDFQAGRLDVSTHPFTDGLGPGDTRITTRYSEHGFLETLGSTLHESGHGLYEQGLAKDGRYGQPLAQSAGLGIHESQSRLWENQVGKSGAFWRWALPEARRCFGAALDGVTHEDICREVNSVRPGLIRVESDEVTYNLHIMMRFDIERAVLRREIRVADVPSVWNDRMRLDLGLDVPDDVRGCLQDMHWPLGTVGYFPTYTLGNLYAAQLWETVTGEIADLDEQIERGEFESLLAWLRGNVHAHGRRFPAPELCERITGKPLDHEPLIEYLRGKLG